jgi:hypothetical protein
VQGQVWRHGPRRSQTAEEVEGANARLKWLLAEVMFDRAILAPLVKAQLAKAAPKDLL